MFQKDSMAKFVTDICYLGARTPFLQKLKRASIGLEVSFKIGIEWQLVGIFISAAPWISLHEVICIKILFHWNKTDAIQLHRKAFQKKRVHICEDMGNGNVLTWLWAGSYHPGKAAQIHRLTQTEQLETEAASPTGIHECNQPTIHSHIMKRWEWRWKESEVRRR